MDEEARPPAGAPSRRDQCRVVAMIWLKDLLFLVAIPGMMVAGFPYVVLRERGAPPAWPSFVSLGWRGAGLLLIAVGAAAFLHCVVAFARRGRGTPFPLDPPRKLVQSGLYQYVRNPMYVAILTIVLGEAAVFGSGELVVYWFSVLASFHLFVVLYEEPTLRKLFGREYETYRRRVPRWVPTGHRLPAAATASG